VKVLIILGHPRNPALCSALAAAYAQGARAAGMDVQELDLSALDFDFDVHTVSPRDQLFEPDLERARSLVAWADHLTFVYPGWWGVGPARLKGFLDRVLLPGFAFHERTDGQLEGLLGGRTAHLITTLDMPPWVYRFIYRAPGHNAMRRSTLGFCGIETTRVLALGPVRESDPARRSAWLERARALGFSLGQGARSPADRSARKLGAWLKALRLQFYPMTWGAYTLGALGAATFTGTWDPVAYWLGYAVLFFIEAATVFTNEWFDFESDRRNIHFGPFNGGSRVLVNGELSGRELGVGIVASMMAALACAGVLLDGAHSVAVVVALTATMVLGLGYTAPPLKFAWRGLGEIDVALTHSLVVIMLGYLLQGGAWVDPFPWLVSAPLFVAVLPAIILSGIPDLEADRQAGKATLAVRLGAPRALLLAAGLAALAAVLVLLLKDRPVLHGTFDGLLAVALPHALLLGVLIYRHWQEGAPPTRIDGLMAVALSYIVWFALLPLLHVW